MALYENDYLINVLKGYENLESMDKVRELARIVSRIGDYSIQNLLFPYLIKSFGRDIPKFKSPKEASRISDHISKIMETPQGKEHMGFLKTIFQEIIEPIEDAAEEILERFRAISDKEERSRFLYLVLYTDFCPYRFYLGDDIHNVWENLNEIIEEKSDIIMKALRAYKGARSGNLLVLADRIVSIIDREDTLTKTVVLACLTSDVLGIPIIDERMPETIIELKRSSLFPPSEEAVPPNIVIY